MAPELQWSPVTPYTSLLVEWFGPLRVQLLTIGLLGGAGLLLACLGLYSFIAYQVASRRVELGIRRALGAPGGRLAWTVVAGGLVMATVGTLLGSCPTPGTLPCWPEPSRSCSPRPCWSTGWRA